jgi:hypothetical protein
MLLKKNLAALQTKYRHFGTLTMELSEYLKKLGLTTNEIVHNPTVG